MTFISLLYIISCLWSVAISGVGGLALSFYEQFPLTVMQLSKLLTRMLLYVTCIMTKISHVGQSYQQCFSRQKEIYMYRQSCGSHLEKLNERYAVNPFLLYYYDHNVTFESFGLTLKIRSRSNQLFPTSQKCFYASV